MRAQVWERTRLVLTRCADRALNTICMVTNQQNIKRTNRVNLDRNITLHRSARFYWCNTFSCLSKHGQLSSRMKPLG